MNTKIYLKVDNGTGVSGLMTYWKSLFKKH